MTTARLQKRLLGAKAQAIAILLVIMLAWALALAAKPSLHRSVHHDCSDATHHHCLVILLLAGGLNVVLLDPRLVQRPRVRRGLRYVVTEQVVFASNLDRLSVLERAPPQRTAGCPNHS
jgi:hypothetical protein